jgi:hypothetical protein
MKDPSINTKDSHPTSTLISMQFKKLTKKERKDHAYKHTHGLQKLGVPPPPPPPPIYCLFKEIIGGLRLSAPGRSESQRKREN